MAVRTEVDGHVLRITLDRPEARNALTWKCLEELSAALVRLEDDDEVWLATITGAGERSFCAGADLKSLPAEAAANAAAGIAPPPTMITGLESTKPLLCAMNGDALGGGLEIALGCDLRIAVDHAQLGLTEGRWGLVPAGGGTHRLAQLVGEARAVELLLTASPIGAPTALQWGLVHRVVGGAELDDATAEMEEAVLRVGPLASRAMKSLVGGARGRSLAESLVAEQAELARLQRSADVAEGLSAFLERRQPVWTAR